jgi:hypothetical protein
MLWGTSIAYDTCTLAYVLKEFVALRLSCISGFSGQSCPLAFSSIG